MKRGVKERILSILKEKPEWHPTAKEIYEQIKNEMPTLAFSSVYRALETLLKEKKVRSFKLDCEDERRFEVYNSSHVHFKCAQCGRVYDIELGIDGAFKELVELRTDHIVNDVHVTYYGICRECFKKKIAELAKKYHV